MSDHALHVVDLSVGYGTQRLVEHLDLTIAPGQIVRLAGHNGSGKSTVLRTVVGRQPALAGEVWVCGVRLEPALGAAKKDLGYAGDDGLAFPLPHRCGALAPHRPSPRPPADQCRPPPERARWDGVAHPP
jgi:ABC-type transport system involved in cytochrome bd biosynthesis fused ATPase/permease subunit